MKNIILMLCIVLILTGCSTIKNDNGSVLVTKNQGDDLKIYVASDPHYFSDELHDNGELYNKILTQGDGKLVNYDNELLNSLFRDCVTNDVDVLVFTGDLTLNGEYQSHLEFSQKLSEFEENTGIQTLVIPGNHDLENPYAQKYIGNTTIKVDSISYNDFRDMYYSSGFSDSVSEDTDSLSYLVKPSEDYWFLMLDTTISSKGRTSPVANGEIKDSTLEWISECGNEAEEAGANLISFTHQNLMDHNDLLTYGFTLDNSYESREVFNDANIKVNFSGHIHAQNIAEKDGIYDIVNSSMAVYNNHVGDVSFQGNTMTYDVHKIDVEGYAQENNLTDENLLNFDQYSEEYFTNLSYSKHIEDDASDIDKEIRLFYAEVNTLYFTGEFSQEFLDENETYNTYVKGNESDYLLSIIDSVKLDNTHLVVEF